jgi:hypothetical protein
VTTIFCPKDLVIDVTTGPLMPLFSKALLKAFLVASAEKLALFPVGDLTRISLWAAFRALEVVVAAGVAFLGVLLPTRVYSSGLLLAELLLLFAT